MRIGKASAAMARLTKRVWENTILTIKTKTQVYQACVLSTLLYSSESWTLYTRKERRLNKFHLRCLRRILGISWQDHIPNTEVLARAGSLSMYALLTKRRLRWLGHVTRMHDGRLPKDILNGELATGSMVHKCLIGRAPDYLSQKFTRRLDLHNKKTRNKKDLTLPRCRLTTGQRSFAYRGPA